MRRSPSECGPLNRRARNAQGSDACARNIGGKPCNRGAAKAIKKQRPKNLPPAKGGGIAAIATAACRGDAEGVDAYFAHVSRDLFEFCSEAYRRLLRRAGEHAQKSGSGGDFPLTKKKNKKKQRHR